MGTSLSIRTLKICRCQRCVCLMSARRSRTTAQGPLKDVQGSVAFALGDRIEVLQEAGPTAAAATAPPPAAAAGADRPWAAGWAGGAGAVGRSTRGSL